MDSKSMWQSFEDSGKIDDFLSFVKQKRAEEAEKDYPRETVVRGSGDMADQNR